MNRLSMRARLTWTNIVLMLVVLVPVGVIGYTHESRAMGDLLDRSLAQSGRTVAALVSDGARLPVLVQRSATGVHPGKIIAMRQVDGDPRIGYQVFDSAGDPVVVTPDFTAFPKPTDADLGFATRIFDGTHWRMFTLRSDSGVLVRIGEQYDTRRMILRSLVLEHSLPLVIGLPLLALMLSFSVRHGLMPLRHLTSLLQARSPGNRQPVVLPAATKELRPLVDTLNLQFERLEDALERERRFSADVAHELRTPLAATMILLDSLSLSKFGELADTALASARASHAHLARRIEQVLALAKLEMGAAVARQQACDIVGLLRDVIDELAFQISDKRITIGFSVDAGDATVIGHAASLAAMFRNVIENALRHIPVAGNVEVIVANTAEVVQVDVRDDGPGIAPDRREIVFARFHRDADERSDGHGLGLSIVRQAATRHGATIVLSDPPEGTGLNVRIVLPRRSIQAT